MKKRTVKFYTPEEMEELSQLKGLKGKELTEKLKEFAKKQGRNFESVGVKFYQLRKANKPLGKPFMKTPKGKSVLTAVLQNVSNIKVKLKLVNIEPADKGEYNATFALLD